jgi:hypothetical protein
MGPARSAASGLPEDALGFDLGQLSPDEVYETYSDLAANASELTEAADPSVQFTAEATGDVQCTAGCVVNASVTDRVTPGANTSGAGSEVTAEMTAQISLDGVPGGVCVSAPTPVPANGTGELTCVDPESGALASALLEEKAAQAPQGTVVTVTIEAQVQIQAQAMTVADVQQQVDRLRSERDQATQGRAPPTYPAEGLQIGQVNLGTRQSGKAAPVGLQGLNVPWDSNDEALRIEAVLGGNLPKGTRAVDVYDPRDGGVAISVKTFDPRSPSYVAQPSLIGSKGKGYVDELVNYSKGIDLWNPVVPPDAVSTWVLRVAYPAGTTDANLLSQLDSILQYGQSKGIVVQLVPIVG